MIMQRYIKNCNFLYIFALSYSNFYNYGNLGDLAYNYRGAADY